MAADRAGRACLRPSGGRPGPHGGDGARRQRGPLSGTLVWRVVHDDPESGARNMALDEALARCRVGDAAVLRLYAWSRPTVSFGRNEPATRLYRSADDLDFVRRPTGGRAVLHDAEVTYAVVAPYTALGGARIAYRRINEALASGLRALGADVSVQAERETAAAPLDAGPCFQLPAAGEVVAGGRKLVGSAQVRVGRTLLQHGSVILSGDQSRVASLGTDPAVGQQVPDGAVATLEELVGGVAPAEVRAALAEAVVEAFGGRAEAATYTQEEMVLAEELVDTKYGRHDWTWRR